MARLFVFARKYMHVTMQTYFDFYWTLLSGSSTKSSVYSVAKLDGYRMLLLLLLLLMLAIVRGVRRHQTLADVNNALNIEAGQKMRAHEPRPKELAVAGVALTLSGMDVALRTDGDLVQAETVVLEPSNTSIRPLPARNAVPILPDAVFIDRATVGRIGVDIEKREVVPRFQEHDVVVALVFGKREPTCSFLEHDRGDGGQLVGDTDVLRAVQLEKGGDGLLKNLSMRGLRLEIPVVFSVLAFLRLSTGSEAIQHAGGVIPLAMFTFGVYITLHGLGELVLALLLPDVEQKKTELAGLLLTSAVHVQKSLFLDVVGVLLVLQFTLLLRDLATDVFAVLGIRDLQHDAWLPRATKGYKYLQIAQLHTATYSYTQLHTATHSYRDATKAHSYKELHTATHSYEQLQ